MKRGIVVGAFVAATLVPCFVHAHEDTYPMPASEYEKREDERLARYRKRLDERLDEHHIPATKRDEARKRLAFYESIIRVMILRAAQDRVVTGVEADQIKTLSKDLRASLYHDLGFERGKGE